MSQPIRVFIIDDHAVLRAGLKMLLDAEEDLQVVGEAADVHQAAAMIDEQKPDVVLMDISMPEVNGLEGLKILKAQNAGLKFLMLTMHDDESYLRSALSAGASGYVLKQAANKELLSAIRVVQQGGTYLHSSHRGFFFDGTREGSTPPADSLGQDEEMYQRLSPREKEILLMIAMGYTNRQAAEELFLSEKTIETYKLRLMAKLNFHNRTELVRYALRLGLIKS